VSCEQQAVGDEAAQSRVGDPRVSTSGGMKPLGFVPFFSPAARWATDVSCLQAFGSLLLLEPFRR